MKCSELKKKRLELGLKQKEFAALLKTPYETYVNWERGVRRVPGVVEVALETILSRAGAEIEAVKEDID